MKLMDVVFGIFVQLHPGCYGLQPSQRHRLRFVLELSLNGRTGTPLGVERMGVGGRSD